MEWGGCHSLAGRLLTAGRPTRSCPCDQPAAMPMETLANPMPEQIAVVSTTGARYAHAELSARLVASHFQVRRPCRTHQFMYCSICTPICDTSIPLFPYKGIGIRCMCSYICEGGDV